MKMNVHNKLIASQYNIISKVFDNSRVRIWNNVKQFLLDDQGRTANTLLDCGKEATVPFVPRNNKPVYCDDCFQNQRRGSRA